jgi:dihydrodipicolinate synthase/N-acetylneuraminate lyase
LLQATDLRGVYAIIPTPANPDAGHIDAIDTVNLAETERLVEQLIADGVHGLIALGTTGECATLTNAEYDAFAETVLRVVNRRVPTFIGTTALGSHEIARRMAFVRDRGADGVLLGMPMWQPLTVDMAVEHYRAMSEAFPTLAIMVYANARAFRFNFTETEFWQRVAVAAPTVMSAKFSVAKVLLALQEATHGKIHFLPIDDEVTTFAKIAPQTTTACWATATSMGPQPTLALMEAILSGDQSTVTTVSSDIAWASEPLAPLFRAPEFASYNIQVEKIRINAAGYCDAGPVRPPYAIVPDDIAHNSQECGRRWKTLCEKYAPTKAQGASR